MSKSTASFVLELELNPTPKQESVLQSRLEAARQAYNAYLGECLKRLHLLRQSKQYQFARSLPRKDKRRNIAFRDANKAFGFTEYSLQAYGNQFKNTWIGEHVDSATRQKLATRAFKAMQRHSFGFNGRPRFKTYNQLDSVEGKSNNAGIRWKDNCVVWFGLVIPTIIDWNDPVVAHGLQHRVKYSRIVRRKLKGGVRFYMQLICEGKPYRKPKNYTGDGYVGLDIGPSTIAIVGENGAALKQFCSELEDNSREIRLLQRKLDRQRRANNPDNYNENGTIKAGKKTWHRSNRQKITQTRLSELQRKQAAYRKSLHGQMVNEIIRMGHVVQLEKVSYRGWQKMWGKSVGMRAPGMFVEQLRRKAVSADVSVNEFPTWNTKLSQTCHNCGRVKKKPLSQRWHKCECGVEAQRDLYSAFLAMCIDGNTLNVDYAKSAWSDGIDASLRTALSEIKTASGQQLPTSFGLQR